MAQSSQEITLKELFIRIKEWIILLLNNWKTIFVIGILGAALGLTISLTTKKVYLGELSFALEEKGGGLGAYAAIASQFGLDLGSSGGSGGAFIGDNLVELLKTRLIVEKTLLSNVTINGKTDLLINTYIDFNDLKEAWKDNETLSQVKFEVGVPREKYTILQDSVLDFIQKDIRKNLLTVKRVDKKLNLVNVICKSENELFSKYFTEELVSNASEYYIENKTSKSKANIRNLENKVDSIRTLLDLRLYGAASDQDRNINAAKATSRVSVAQKQIDIQLLTAVYVELTKNLEISKFSLLREEPLIQVIDTPILPLNFERKGKLSSMIIYGFLFGFLAVLFVTFKQKVKDIF